MEKHLHLRCHVYDEIILALHVRCSPEKFINGFNFIKKQEFYVQNEIIFLSNVKISVTSHFSYLYLSISYCLLKIMGCFYMLEVTHI